MMLPRRHDQKGFTLFELLLSAAIFGTIMIIAVSVISVTASAQRRVQVLTKISGDTRYILDLIAQSVRIDGIDYSVFTYKNYDDVRPPYGHIATVDSEGTKRVYRAYGEKGCWSSCGDLKHDVIGVCEIKKGESPDKCTPGVCNCPGIHEYPPFSGNKVYTPITPDTINIDGFVVWPHPLSSPYAQPPSEMKDCVSNHAPDMSKYPLPVPYDWNYWNDASGFDAARGVCVCASGSFCWSGQTCEGDATSGEGVCTNPNEQPRATIIIRSSSITNKPEEKVTTMLQTTVTPRQYKR